MFKLSRSMAAGLAFLCLLACFSASAAEAQTEAPPTALDRQLARVQLAVTAEAFTTTSVTGTNYLGTTITQKPSNTVGVLATLRYTKSRFVGFEGNYSYARYTEKYTCLASSPYCVQGVTGGPCAGIDPSSPSAGTTVCPAFINGGAQVDPSEYSLGYVIHPGKLFGLNSYVSVGAGTMAFRPTRYGGQQVLEQARAVYYYSAGVERTLFSPHFGVHAQIRETFFKAPDQLANYLTINKHTTTFQPGFGFFLRF